VDGRPGEVYHGGMKHVPEQHQSIAPTPSVWLALAAVAFVMAVVWVVVSLAS
jgi:hypothetical protein